MSELAPRSSSENKIAIPLDIIEVDPETQERIKLLHERQALILPIVEAAIPERTNEQIITRESRRKLQYGRQLEPQEEHDRMLERASRVRANESSSRKAANLASSKIPVEELGERLAKAYEVAEVISLPDEGVEWQSTLSILNYADNVADIEVARDLMTEWHGTLLEGVSPEDFASRVRDALDLLSDIAGKNVSPRPPKREEDEVRDLFNGFVELYKVAYQGQVDENGQLEFREPVTRIEQAGLDWHGSAPVLAYVDILKQAMAYSDLEIGKAFANSTAIYTQNHSMDKDTADRLVQRLLPAMGRRDPQVELLIESGNYAGMRKGDYGALDFIVEAYGAAVNPSSVNELLMISRDIPTSNAARLERNRKDGLMLAKDFLILRDFIHDQRPGVHAILTAMVKYYETGESESLVAEMDKTDYFRVENERYREVMLNLDNYDKILSRGDPTPDDETAIAIIRRLEGNTRPVEEHPPEVSSPELAKLLENLENDPSNGSLLEKTLAYMNTYLVKQMDEDGGIEPNDALAISWLEQRCFKKLQSMTFETQTTAYKQPWFRQVLLFEELTASVDFDNAEFDNYYEELTKLGSEAAYKLIASHTLTNVQALAKVYSEKGWEEKNGALWSGNTAHELIGLVDLRQASTAVGDRLRKEMLRPPKQRRTGD